ncbi:MAG: serine protease [Bacillota bacterium]|nr:serine protease [Bacillota bacterium]
MKTKKCKILLRTLTIIVVILTIIYPSIRSKINQKIHEDFIENIGQHVLSANVMIIQDNYKREKNGSTNSISAGASGAIFRKEGNKYFLLTAAHVVESRENVDKTNIIVMGYNDLEFKDYLNNGGEYKGISNYYEQFPRGEVEYYNEKYDLAVVSFYSDKDYKVLSISDKSPEYGDIVGTVSNPYGERNSITAGKVVSRKPKPFGDESGKMQFPVIRHTAMISEGSSGSAILNKNLEIVGINLGGNENIFRQYVSGMAMSSDRILDFLNEWERK